MKAVSVSVLEVTIKMIKLIIEGSNILGVWPWFIREGEGKMSPSAAQIIPFFKKKKKICCDPQL